MIIDHTHPLYKSRLKDAGNNKYNGAYYYSKEIVKNIIPNVNTSRNWVTVNLPNLDPNIRLNHSIVFIHNNLQPNAYQWLRRYYDLILVCGVPSTMEKVKFFGKPIYLPLSVDVKSVEKYKTLYKSKDAAFAGRLNKMTKRLPSNIDILSGIPQSKLLVEMSRYQKIYAVGRTAIQARILGCEIGVYDERFLDPSIWRVIDNKEAAKILQNELDKIDKEN